MLILIFIISCTTTYLLSKIAAPIGLLAHPDQHRLHATATPLLGGLAIFIGIAFGTIVVSNDFINLLPSLMLLCFVGLLDDRYKLPSTVRFIAQAVAVILMIRLTGVQLSQLGSLISEEVIMLGPWSTPMTIFAVIGVINAVNMSDGLDGLAGSLVILILLSLLLSGSTESALIMTTIVSIMGFLMWNARIVLSSAKIFMGDAGSTMLGLIVAYCLVQSSQQIEGLVSPVTALWLFALPLFDAVAVLIARPVRGKSPFLADRIHYHHLLKDSGLGVNQVVLIVLAIQTIFILLAFALLYFNVAQNTQFFAFLSFFVMYLLIVLKRSGS